MNETIAFKDLVKSVERNLVLLDALEKAVLFAKDIYSNYDCDPHPSDCRKCRAGKLSFELLNIINKI